MEDLSKFNKRGWSIKRGGWIFFFSDLLNREQNNSLNKRGVWKYFLEIPTLVGGQKSDLYNIELLNMM